MARLKRLAWLRNEAESNNSALEDKLFNKKAASVGHLSQTATFSGTRSSSTLYLVKRRGGVRCAPQPPDTIAVAVLPPKPGDLTRGQ